MTIRRQVITGLALSAVLMLALEGIAWAIEKPALYRYDPVVGYRLVPGFTDPEEGETINAHGLRGPEIGAKAPGEYRVLCMGGSTTFGSGVDDGDTWPAALQDVLREQGYAGARVLNGGVNGWGLEQIVRILQTEYLETVQPDLVLVYSGWNYPVIEGNPTIARYQRKSKTSPVRSGLYRSALVRRLARLGRKLEADRVEASGETSIDRMEVRRSVADVHYTPLVAELAETCAERGVALGLVAYPALYQIDVPATIVPEAVAAVNRIYEKEFTTRDEVHDYIDGRRIRFDHARALIDATGAATGVPVLEVDAVMQARFTGPEHPDGFDYLGWLECFTDSAHKTPRGNRIIGEILAPMLQERGWGPE